MKTKELLTVEFRYTIKPKNGNDEEDYNKRVITIGVYDTLDEAIKQGNIVLEMLKTKFKFLTQYENKFKKNHLWGMPNRLVCSSNYNVFAKIEQLKFDDIEQVSSEVARDIKEYSEYIKLN